MTNLTDLSFLTEYLTPIIVGLCFCVGLVVKKWVKDIDNKFIPTICAALGTLLSIWMSWPNITPSTLLSGLFSGLAATGLHQAVVQYKKNKDLTDAGHTNTADLQTATLELPGIDVEILTDDQLRSVLQQMGYAATENMTREQLLDTLDKAAE